MKTAYLLLALMVSANAFACFDPPSPITLTGTSFADQDFSVSSKGLGHNGEYIYFDQTAENADGSKGKWCYQTKNGSKSCDIKPQVTITDPKNGNKIIGVLTLDKDKKTALLKSVKEPYSKNNFTVDEEAAYLEFTDKSDPVGKGIGSSDRFIARAMDAQGNQLGKVVSTHGRGAKAVSTAKPNARIDLANAQAYQGGCGGTSAVPSSDKPKSQFGVGKPGGGKDTIEFKE
ncbi:hypothetical protein K2X33_16290 [bacterium]|nr:hypothetical protein [bacterium]